MQFPATIYSTRTSENRAVELTFSSNKIIINGSTDSDVFLLSNIEYASPLGRLPHEIRLPNGALLTVDNQHDLSRFFSKKTQLITRLEQHKLFCLIALLLVPLCLYGIIEKLIPASARSVAPLMPQSALSQIDKQVLIVLDKMMLDPSELEQTDKLTLEQHIHVENLSTVLNLDKYQLNYRKSDAYGANAFALPGGQIIVTDGLHELLKDDPQALVAVLLHEIGHVEHHHGLQLMAESVATTILMTYFFGDMEGVVEVFTGTALTVIQNNFSQQLEREADAFATKQLKLLGIPPKSLADALSKLAKNSHHDELLEKYFSSHPSIKERVEFAREQGGNP